MKSINNFDDLNKLFTSSFTQYRNTRIVKDRLPDKFILFPVERNVLCNFCATSDVSCRIELPITCDEFIGHVWICNVVTCKSCLSLLKK